MTIYIDTSVLVSTLAEDGHTARAQTWIASRPRLLVSTWTLAELSSVLALRRRRGALSAAEIGRAERQVEIMTSDPGSVEAIAPDDVLQARNLVRSARNLRAPDALHLAVALRLGLPLATFDEILLEAAVDSGCPVVDL